jgi:predicted dehydrogenase
MIGHGSVTEVKSGPGLYKSEHSKLRGIYGRNPDKAEDYAKRHGVEIVYDSVEAMLKDPLIDAVYLPVPPKFHKAYALQCLEAGKIPYIEKPMAQTYEECLEIMDKAREKNLPVYVAFYRRGMEKYQKIKQMIDSDTIGTIRCVEVRHLMQPEVLDFDRENLPWRLIPEIAGGGKFLDMAVHVLDILDYFFGNIVEVSGLAENLGGLYDVEDTVSASFRFANGVMGSGLWCFVADHAEESVRIIGDKGTMTFEGLGYGPVTVKVGDQSTTYAFKAPEHVGQPYIQSIVNELAGLGESPASLESAANIIKVTDQILKAYRKRYEVQA